MISYSNERIKLENSQGKSCEFSKSKCLIPIRVQDFEINEEFDLVKSEEPVISSILGKELDINLSDYGFDYEDAVDDYSHDLFREISYELKVLSEHSRIDSIKTDGSSMYVVIRPEETEMRVHPERFRLDSDDGEYRFVYNADGSNVGIRHRNGHLEVLASDFIKFAQAIR